MRKMPSITPFWAQTCRCILEQFAIAYTVGADLRVCPGGWL